jgi:predicted metalloprotease
MKWEGQEQSENVEDRRADGGGGGGGPLIGGRGNGLGSIAIALVAGWVFGINPMTVLGLLSDGGGGAAPMTQSQAPARGTQHARPADKSAQFVSVVLRDTEKVWGGLFQAGGKSYVDPTLVLFRGATPTACGTGQRAMGPFYCPGDSQVYLDLDFFDSLSRRLGAPGDFAQAYVIAHEVGHHVQHLLGVTQRVDAMRARQSKAQANATSVRVELQADCLAGVWAHHSHPGQSWLEQGDIEEALNAASRIGDDTLQAEAGRAVVPETFTHGSSEQRVRWFRRGLQSGSVKQCNTFDGPAP